MAAVLIRTDTPLSQVFSNDFWGLPLSDPESHKSYRPLVVLSFRANRLLHGLWAPGFHLVNTSLHAVVTSLYCWLLGRLRLDWSTVMSASLLFAAHPVHTEAVSDMCTNSSYIYVAMSTPCTCSIDQCLLHGHVAACTAILYSYS